MAELQTQVPGWLVEASIMGPTKQRAFAVEEKKLQMDEREFQADERQRQIGNRMDEQKMALETKQVETGIAYREAATAGLLDELERKRRFAEQLPGLAAESRGLKTGGEKLDWLQAHPELLGSEEGSTLYNNLQRLAGRQITLEGRNKEAKGLTAGRSIIEKSTVLGDLEKLEAMQLWENTGGDLSNARLKELMDKAPAAIPRPEDINYGEKRTYTMPTGDTVVVEGKKGAPQSTVVTALQEAERDLAESIPSGDPAKIEGWRSRINTIETQLGLSPRQWTPLPASAAPLGTATRSFLERKVMSSEQVLSDISYLKDHLRAGTIGPGGLIGRKVKDFPGVGMIVGSAAAVDYDTRATTGMLNATEALLDESGRLSDQDRQRVAEAFAHRKVLQSVSGQHTRLSALERTIAEKAFGAARLIGKLPSAPVLRVLTDHGQNLSRLSVAEIDELVKTGLVSTEKAVMEIRRRNKGR